MKLNSTSFRKLIIFFVLCFQNYYVNSTELVKTQLEVDNIIMKECERLQLQKDKSLCENAIRERFNMKTKYINDDRVDYSKKNLLELKSQLKALIFALKSSR